MLCRDIERDVDSFIDGEFAEPERLEFETHLAECPGCTRLVSEQARFKASLRAAIARPQPPAPEALCQRIRSMLDEADRRSRPRPGVRTTSLWAVPAFLVGLPVLCLSTGWLDRSRCPVVNDSIIKHQRNLPLEITGGPDVVRSWFHGKLPFAVRTPRLEPVASLRGGRLASLGNREAAYLVYELPGGPGNRISVFVFDAHDMPLSGRRREVVGSREVYLEDARGYQVAVFRDHDVGYAITSAMEEPDMLRLVRTAFGNP